MFSKETYLVDLFLLLLITASSQLTFFNSDVHTTKRALQNPGRQFLNLDPVTEPLSDILQGILKNNDIAVDTVILKTDRQIFIYADIISSRIHLRWLWIR